MNDLTTQNNQIQVSHFETKVERVFQSNKFLNSTEKEMKLFLLDQVSKSFLLRGYKTTDQDNAIIVTELLKEIQKRFKAITFKEIEIAFENGLRGEYGEYMGLSVITFSNFIKGFKESRQRADMIKLHKEVKEEVVVTEEEKKKNFEEFLESCIFKPYETRSYNLYSWSYIYDFFRSIGYCRFNEKTESEIIKKAKSVSLEKAKAKKLSNPRDHKIKSIVERFNSGEEVLEDWKFEARKIAVINQFEMFHEVGEDLRVLIKEIIDERNNSNNK